ncbi:unnamed protein product [Lactuca saligna]|uniref:Uncharacterized protein n=1 Tax=Lactuca saligna TaxID=75948 RepID=A0AA35ZEX1_LACSI|nr:unnamed protein product [Lactuca saligna]
MLLREKEKYEHAMSHLQLIIKSYIQEVSLMDVNITTVLKKKPTAVPKEAPKDFENLKPGKHTRKDEFILDLITKFKGNHKGGVKCLSDMILWYIQIRKMLLSFIPKIYKVQKRITR